MKPRVLLFRPPSAFTLIELITVIAIIAILMSLLFPVLAAAREHTRRGKAKTVAKVIVNACKNYANDYGKYPPIPDALVDGGDGGTGDGTSYYSYGDTQNAKCKVANNQLF